MTRIFKRGELQPALLDVLGQLGQANGYAIMQALGEHVGSGWRPSPGAIYPALLGLEDAGLIQGDDQDGSRTYSLTLSGSRALTDASGTVERVAERARVTPVRPTAGAVLDSFVASVMGRSRRLSPAEEVELHNILDGVRAPIEAITTGGEQ